MHGLRKLTQIFASALVLGVLTTSLSVSVNTSTLSADEGSKTARTVSGEIASEVAIDDLFDHQIWDQVLQGLREQLTSSEFDTLRTGSRLVRVNQDTIRIETLNPQAQTLAEGMIADIEALIQQVMGLASDAEISIQHEPGEESPIQDSRSSESTTSNGMPSQANSVQDSESHSTDPCDDLSLSPMAEGLQQSLRQQMFNGDKNGDGVWGNPGKDARKEYMDQIEQPNGPHSSLREKWEGGKFGVEASKLLVDTVERNADEDVEVAMDLAVKALEAEAAYEKAVEDAANLPANATQEEVDAAIEKAEAAKAAADAARKAADEARKKVTDPDFIGGGDPCEDQGWFSETLPHLVGTIWDPYAKQNSLEERDPSRPSPETSNPNPFEYQPTGELPENPTSSLAEQLGGDCDDIDECGSPDLSEAQAQQMVELGDPQYVCGPTSNTGPDGDCGMEEDSEVPEPQAPDSSPGCAFCGEGQGTSVGEALDNGNAESSGLYYQANEVPSNGANQGEVMRAEP